MLSSELRLKLPFFASSVHTPNEVPTFVQKKFFLKKTDVSIEPTSYFQVKTSVAPKGQPGGKQRSHTTPLSHQRSHRHHRPLPSCKPAHAHHSSLLSLGKGPELFFFLTTDLNFMLQQNKEDYAVVALDSVSRVQTPVSCSNYPIPIPSGEENLPVGHGWVCFC